MVVSWTNGYELSRSFLSFSFLLPLSSVYLSFVQKTRSQIFYKPICLVFTDVGCFLDKWIRAIPTLEGNHPLLMDSDYKTRSDPLQKCAEAALDKGLHMFALQNGGQCFGGKTGDLRYNIYGTSAQCKGENNCHHQCIIF